MIVKYGEKVLTIRNVLPEDDAFSHSFNFDTWIEIYLIVKQREEKLNAVRQFRRRT